MCFVLSYAPLLLLLNIVAEGGIFPKEKMVANPLKLYRHLNTCNLPYF